MAIFVKTTLALVLCSLVFLPFSDADVMPENVTMWEQTMANADWIKQGIRGHVNELIFKQYRAANISQSCKEGMDLYSTELDEWKPWAMKMADATTKLPAGILAGTRLDFGAFDECLAVRTGALQGRFCMAGFSSPIINSTRYGVETYARKFGQPPEWIEYYLANKGDLGANGTMWLGICLPSTCSEKDVHSILSTRLISLKFDVKLKDCQVDEPKEVSFNSIVSLCAILIILTLCVVGTLLDAYYKPNEPGKDAEIFPEKEGYVVATLKTFSVRLNLYRLYMISNHVTCLDFSHGFRVIVCFIQVYTHVVSYPNRWIVERKSGILRADGYLVGFVGEAAIIQSISIFIDIFFVFSGCLLVFTKWGKLEKNGGYVNIPLFFLKRCCRIYPAFLFAMALLFVAPFLNRGPIWNSTWGEQVQNCEGNMWKNLLFISNYWGWKEGQCLPQTWFISALMQIQVPGLLLLLFTFRFPKGGIVVGCLAVAGSCLVLFIEAMDCNGLTPTFVTNDLEYFTSHYEEFYFKPLAHFPPYVVGMVTGYILLKHKDKVPSKRWQVAGWAATAAAGWWGFNGLDLVPLEGGAVHLALYIALNKLFCAMGWAWIMYACTAGIAETLRKCLSWKPLIYFSNLHFTMYLLHPLLLFYESGASRERTSFAYNYFIYDTMAVLVMGYAISFLAYLAVESPFSILEWKLLGSDTPVKSKPEDEDKKTT